MYIVAIAWLYVTLMMAMMEKNLVAGVLTFVFFGLAPCALVLWLFGTPLRRRARLKREKSAAEAALPPATPSLPTAVTGTPGTAQNLANQVVNQHDSGDARRD